MERNFHHIPAGNIEPVVFVQVFAEKEGGGIVSNPSFDLPTGLAVSESLFPIKAYRLTKAVATADTTIEIAKSSGVVVGDIIGRGKKAVACTAVDSSNVNHDVVTVTLGVDIPSNSVLYQAKAGSADSAVPVYSPKYVLGKPVYAGEGAQEVRLVIGAVMRKETAPVSEEVAELMTNISIV